MSSERAPITAPEPDDIDIFIHNHAVLNKLSWLCLAVTALLCYEYRLLAAICAFALAILSRGMSRLLCGWVHTWALRQLEAMPTQTKVKLL